MRMLNLSIAGLALLVAFPVAAQQQRYGLGAALTGAEIKAWDIDVRPDGAGLPPGRGSVKQGQQLYVERCSACHGEKGNDGPTGFDRLVGGKGTLTSARPVRTVASFWPYATTLYDYVYRAMPFMAPQSLTPDETYAIVAYVLFLDQIVPQNTVLDAKSLPRVKMPNANGFVPDSRPDIKGDSCMSDCK
jgi:S-disulfanyl-L-cysteine oxidoreductase SoxD